MAQAPYGFEIGTTLGGYRIERLLGRGGMGIVYLAEHAKLRRPAALKILAPELADTDDFRARFIQESQLAASIDHPSVIPIYDAGEVGDVLYIAMRYVKGSDLRAVLRAGPLSPRRAVAILDQVAGGLHAAHCEGLVHRDVKPANILVEDDTARIYVSDFGVARRTAGSGLTRTGSLVGTIDYCSPEQIEGKRLDGRADVYSLGCVLFHCLAGQPPFPSESEFAVLNAHLYQEPPPVSRHRTDTPPALDSVIATALAKRPGDRYSTTVELAAACRRAMPDQTAAESTVAPRFDRATPLVPAPPSPPHPAATWPETVPQPPVPGPAPSPKRQRRRVLLLTVAVLLLGAGAVGAFTLSLGGGKAYGTGKSGPGVKALIARRLQTKLVPLQQVLTDRVRNASSTASSIAGIETAAANVQAAVGRTQGWSSASLHPRTASDRALTSALTSALSAHAAYASYLADLAPATSITKVQATTAVARSRAAEDAYARLTGAGLNRPAMPLSGTDTEHLVAVAQQQTTSHPPPPAAVSYDTVAFSNGTGVRYRYTPNHWCGYSPDGSPVPKTNPCWNDVVPGAGAAEGEQLRVYCYTSGAVVKGDTLWAKVSENPDEYVPATYLLAAHGGPVSGVPSC